MKRLFGLSLALCLFGGFVGCTKKAETEKSTTVTTPEGETTTTESKAIEQSGDNPPPAQNLPRGLFRCAKCVRPPR
jgi:hypothetical protein